MCHLLQEHGSKPKRHHENGRKSSEIYVHLGGLVGPFSRTSLCRLCSSASFAVGSHSFWFWSTPSAAGSSPAESRSSPQKEGRRTGAGVTGREGRSISVGKSVIFMEARRLDWTCEGGFSEVGDVIDDSVLVVLVAVEDSAGWEE